MQLIIDIPEEQYNDIVKHLTDNDGNYAYSDFNLREIIRNGTPYNPSGDCISREWLEDAFDNLCCHNCKMCRNFRIEDSFYKCALIDNAPTVDIKDQIAGAYNEVYMCGNKEAEKARPKGEWYYGEDECGQDGWFCSECNFFVPWYYQYYEKDINFIRDYKACPHCLAEMVTYTGKDRDTKGGAE